MERPTRLVVTTALRPRSGLAERARVVAGRCGAPLLERRRLLEEELREHDATHVYLVGNAREEVRDVASGESLFVHLGLTVQRSRTGLAYPLLRAVQPEGAPPVRRVLDATLGRVGDAHHFAYVLGADVVGLEASPVLFSLAEEGVARVARGDAPIERAMARVHVVHAEAERYLASLDDERFDVVYLDPMVRFPAKAQPGFDVLRAFARHAPPSRALLEHAARVASARVVVKLPTGEPPPDAPFAWRRLFASKTSYAVYEKR